VRGEAAPTARAQAQTLSRVAQARCITRLMRTTRVLRGATSPRLQTSLVDLALPQDVTAI